MNIYLVISNEECKLEFHPIGYFNEDLSGELVSEKYGELHKIISKIFSIEGDFIMLNLSNLSVNIKDSYHIDEIEEMSYDNMHIYNNFVHIGNRKDLHNISIKNMFAGFLVEPQFSNENFGKHQ